MTNADDATTTGEETEGEEGERRRRRRREKDDESREIGNRRMEGSGLNSATTRARVAI